MKTITVRIPEHLNLSENDYLMALASKLYQDGKLSSGHAAEIADLSKRTFLEMLGNFNVSVFSSSIEDLDKDIENT